MDPLTYIQLQFKEKQGQAVHKSATGVFNVEAKLLRKYLKELPDSDPKPQLTFRLTIN